ncbi:MAG: PucR family transcriptional regulator [Chloroflexota bacterium]
MALPAAQIPSILGSALDGFWSAGAASRRPVSCVTVLRHKQECTQCRFGEAVILSREIGSLAEIDGVIAAVASHQVAAIMIPSAHFPDQEHAHFRELSERHELSLGLLGPHIDPLLAANTLSRALASTLAEGQHTPLRGANSLQELVDMLGRLLGNSVTIETPHHDLLVFSAMEGPVDRAREETILRRRGKADALAWVVGEGYVNRIRKSDRPVRIPPNTDLDFNGRLTMRVAAEGELLGIIWATDTTRVLTPDDEDLLVQGAEAAAGILLQQREATQRDAQVRAEFLEDVVHGRITSPESIRALASSLGWDINRRQQSLVVEIDGLEALRVRHAERSGRRLQRVRERLTEIVRLETLAIDSDAIVGPRSTGVIVLFAASHSDADRGKLDALHLAEVMVHRVAALIPDMTVSVGIGREFTTFEHTAESVRQAELAARLGASLWGGNRATHYSDLGIHRALFALQEHEEMITPALQQIIEHDRVHDTNYVQTLSMYLACMGRLRVAAEQLNIHRNTLEYRMRRIEAVAGVGLDDPNNRLALELGIRMLDMKRTTDRAG